MGFDKGIRAVGSQTDSPRPFDQSLDANGVAGGAMMNEQALCGAGPDSSIPEENFAKQKGQK